MLMLTIILTTYWSNVFMIIVFNVVLGLSNEVVSFKNLNFVMYSRNFRVRLFRFSLCKAVLKILLKDKPDFQVLLGETFTY